MTRTPERTPYGVMLDTLSKPRSLGESAPVTLPAWAATELLRLANQNRQTARERGTSAEYQGQQDALWSVLNRATQDGLAAAGLPGEEGTVLGEACTVRLWPADGGWSAVREPVAPVRPLRLQGVHAYTAVTVQPGGEARFIVDGRWVTREAFGEHWQWREASRVNGMVERLATQGGGTFLMASFLRASGEWQGASEIVAYPVVPAGR